MKISEIAPFGTLIEASSQNQHVNELDIEMLRTHFRRSQLVTLRGFQTFNTAEAFADFCARWGEISLWPFGKVLELVEHENPQDHIFDNNYVPLHWDGMYRPQVPEYQIFHCVQAPLKGKGGRTTFSNTRKVLDHATNTQRDLWSRVTGHYKRQMEFYKSTTVSPILEKHPLRHFPVIRYNEPPALEKGDFLNPPDLEFTGLAENELADFHRELHEALYDAKNFYAHEWQTGDIVIADNFTLLHGRESFVSKSPRHIRRVHVLSDPPVTNPGLESYS
jgi:alpha-ketoglutarate-dependent taurine dioxygenase